MSTKITNQLGTFFSHVRKTPFCWFWTGQVDDEGYAWTDVPHTPTRAIRFLYESEHGPLPPSKRLSMVCGSNLCVNPGHIVVHAPYKKTRDLQRRLATHPYSKVELSWPESFWWRAEKVGDCWLWSAGIQGGGYGVIRVNGRSELAHRQAFLLVYGEVPDGLELDHTCRNRACVNPAHLEPVTHLENLARAKSFRQEHEVGYKLRTECRRGHPYTEQNTGLFFNRQQNKTRRYCRTCFNDARQRHRTNPVPSKNAAK